MKMTGSSPRIALAKQPLRIERVRRAHDLQPWNVREERLGRLRVVVPALDAAADRHAHDDRRRVLAAGAIAELGQLVHDLIEGGIDVVAELDLRDRPQPVQGHPDRGRRRSPTRPAACRCSGRGRTLPADRRSRGTRRRSDRRPRPARRRARSRRISTLSASFTASQRFISGMGGVSWACGLPYSAARWQVEAKEFCAGALRGRPPGARSL